MLTLHPRVANVTELDKRVHAARSGYRLQPTYEARTPRRHTGQRGAEAASAYLEPSDMITDLNTRQVHGRSLSDQVLNMDETYKADDSIKHRLCVGLRTSPSLASIAPRIRTFNRAAGRDSSRQELQHDAASLWC